MTGTLFHLEWRRHRSRIAKAVGTGFVAPPASVLIGALLSVTGPTPARSGVRETVTEFLAIFVLLLCIAWLVAMPKRIFQADRRAGTERFLLDRPVPRSRTWWVRLLLSLAGVVVAVAATLAGWLVAAGVAGVSEPGDLLLEALHLVSANPIPAVLETGAIAVFIFTMGAAGATLGGLPVIALGTVTVIGIACGTWLLPGGTRVAVPFMAAALLAAGAALVTASFVGETRGEPAGRDRLRRGVVAALVVLAIAAMPLGGFAWFERRQALRCLSPGPPSPARIRGPLAVLPVRHASRGAWLVDPASGERLRVFPRAVACSWSPDGALLAVVEDDDGSVSVLLVDDGGRGAGRLVPLGPAGAARYRVSVAWGPGVVWVASPAGTDRYGPTIAWRIDLATGTPEEAFRRPGAARVLEPAGRDHVLVTERVGEGNPRVIRVTPADGSAGEPAVVVPDLGDVYLHAAPLLRSPSARWWLTGDPGAGRWSVYDPETASTIPVPAPGGQTPGWTAGDRLAWLEQPRGAEARVLLWKPGDETPRVIGTFPSGDRYQLLRQPAPPFRLLVTTWGSPAGPGLAPGSLWTWDEARGTWSRHEAPVPPRSTLAWSWASRDGFALQLGDRTFLVDLAAPDPHPVPVEP